MSIESRWQEFTKEVLAERRLPLEDIELMRRAFYAGAAGTMLDTFCSPRGFDEQVGHTYVELERHSNELARPAYLN